jgi:hypothetical protein
LTLFTIGIARQHRHVTNPPPVVGDIAVTLMLGTVIGLPAFLAGQRYQRRSN